MSAVTSEGDDVLDAVVVGAGFAGLYALHRLRAQGLTVRVLEAAPGGRRHVVLQPVSGGALRRRERRLLLLVLARTRAAVELVGEVRHPGRDPEVPQLGGRRAGLRRGITFNTRVVSAELDEVALRWTVTTDTGEAVTSRFCVMATGPLSAAPTPDFNGLNLFGGDVYHTAHWPDEPVDFTGKRVAVIGTGSSGIQSMPVIAERAANLYVFQRTPNYSVPAGNRPSPTTTARGSRRVMPNAVGCRGTAWWIAAHAASQAHDGGFARRAPCERTRSVGELGGVLF